MPPQNSTSSRTCACGCGGVPSSRGQFLRGHHHGSWPKPYPRPILAAQACACGCGQMTVAGNAFVHGHNWRNKKRAPHKAWNLGLTKDDPRIAKGIEPARLRRALWLSDPENRAKLDESRRHRRLPEGPEHWHWRGGVTSERTAARQSRQYKAWRLAVYQRDHFRCQRCGRKAHGRGSLVAHHIQSFSDFPSLRYELSNGVTLCRPCHTILDPRMGDYRGHLRRKITLMRPGLPVQLRLVE